MSNEKIETLARLTVTAFISILFTLIMYYDGAPWSGYILTLVVFPLITWFGLKFFDRMDKIEQDAFNEYRQNRANPAIREQQNLFL